MTLDNQSADEVYFYESGNKRFKLTSLPRSEKIHLIDLYNNGMNGTQLSKRYAVSSVSIYNFLNKNGITMRDSSECHTIYTINETFFKSINTEEKAYWLGFISGDGTIYDSVSESSLVIALKKEDIQHLFLFRKNVEATNPVTTHMSKVKGKTYESCRIAIFNRIFVKNIIALGVLPNKSHTLSMCDKIPPNLRRHYWRGLVDADGSLLRDTREGRKDPYTVGLVGSKSIVESFGDFVYESNIKTKAKCRKSKSIFAIRFSGNAGYAVTRLLYFDSTVALHRKKKMSKQILSSRKRELICLDFDGCISNSLHTKYNQNEFIFEPVEGMREWIQGTLHHHDIIIFSARNLTLIGRENLREWLLKYEFPILDVTNVKPPPGHLFIDDRGFSFRGKNFPSLKFMSTFKPWNRK